MILIDTNVLIYATIPAFTEHERARAFLAGVAGGSVHHCVTWINVFEYLRAVTHRRLLRPTPLRIDAALKNVRSLLGHPRVSRIDPGPRHLELFEKICRQAAPVEGNFVHDCRIAAVMLENGVDRIATRDTSFRRIPNLTVIDPLVDASGER